MEDSNQQYEQQHLDDTVHELHAADKRLTQEIAKTQSEERSISDNFFSDFSINLTNDDEIIETAASVQQQQQLLDERANAHRQSTVQLGTVKRLLKNPYFARIDFQEAGEKPETIYIGLGSFTDADGHFLIYDWRAPISSIYYDGKLGQVTYQTPDGPQNVELSLKRQFVIKDGVQIETMFDTAETIGDQMLLEVLGEKSDTQMKSIVTTIQREQNQIIRDTTADLLFVQGAAGSGKTSAVLQRVAYLLYRYRGNLTSSQVIMFSPNQLFSDYIGNVLPEMGEQNMVQFTYYQYVTRRTPGLEVQNLFQQFEANQTPLQAKVAALKESGAFFRATEAYAEHLRSAGVRFKDIRFRDGVFFSRKKIAEIFYSYNQNYNMNNRLQATKERLTSMLNRRVGSETRAKWVREAVENLSEEEIRDLQSQGQPGEFKDSDSEFQFYARHIVTNAFEDIDAAIIRNRFLNVRAQYVAFLRAVPEFLDVTKFGITVDEWTQSVEEFVDQFRERKLTMADATPYLHLYDLMIGRHGDRKMRFVFIDEIQDYTPYQLAYLQKSFPRAKFTLLGDLNQAIFTGSSARNLMGSVTKMFDPDKTRVVQLTQSYRSTAQVTEFTKAILKSGQKIVAFNRQGDLPQVLVRKDVDAAFAALTTQLQTNAADHDATAVITRSLGDAEALQARLHAAGQKSTLIRSENQRLVPGVLIVPSFLAKGLEFDAVVAWDVTAANFGGDADRELLYTICSRAMHRLTVIAAGTVSPLIAAIDPDLYTTKQ